jgi:ferredoxin-NADP reductase
MTTFADCSIGYKQESTYGTGVTVDRFLEFNSEDLDFTPARQTRKGMRVGRRTAISGRKITTTKQAGGPFETDIWTKGLGTLLQGAFGHQTKFGTFSGGTFAVWFWQFLMYGTVGLFLLYRWVDPLWLSWKHRLRVDKVVQENNDVVSVYVTGIRMNELVFEAGQYTSWRFHFGPLWRQAQTGFLFPHPFSFSQSFNGTHIRLTAKALGDFTKQLPTLEPGVRVTIARPLGRFVLPTVDKAHGVDPKTKVLFIAGGIGVTPFFKRALEQPGHYLLYANRTRQSAVLRTVFKKALGNRYTDILSRQDGPLQAGEVSGRISSQIIEQLIPNAPSKHYFVCGPESFTQHVFQELLRLDVPPNQISLEAFSF